jgi:hypothetical protein
LFNDSAAVVDNLGAGRAVGVVAKAGQLAGAGFDLHLAAQFRQGRHVGGYQRHAPLARIRFFDDGNVHGVVGQASRLPVRKNASVSNVGGTQLGIRTGETPAPRKGPVI